MFCGNCGTKVKDGALFCPECGTRLEPKGFAQPPVSGGTQKTPKKPKKSSKGLIAVVAVVVVLALVISVVGVIFGSPSAKLVRALAKSGKAFYSAAEDTNLTKLGDLVNKKESSQVFSVWLDEIDGASELEGAGIRVSMDSSLSDREIAMSMTPYFGSADLVNLQMKLDNEKIYVGSPELTKDTYYMINTATIGKDLDNLLDLDEISDLSFNLFDLAEELEKINSDNKDMQKAIQKALKKFAKDIEVEKAKSETIEVNEHDLKCTAYHVIITEDALDQLLDALEDAYGTVDNTKAYMELMESIGLPDEVMDEVEYIYDESDSSMEESFEVLHDAVDELGDIELDLYVNKGYVVAAIYEASFDGVDLEAVLNIGGGKNYVDDISLRLIGDDEYELAIVSTGNHTGKGGKFTDETTIEADGYTVAEMELTYSPKADTDNFEWKLKSDGLNMSAEGAINCDSNALAIRLDKVKIEDYFSRNQFGVEYQIGKYKGNSIKIGNSLELAKMSEDELSEEFTELGENAMEWMQDLVDVFPDIMYYLY